MGLNCEDHDEPKSSSGAQVSSGSASRSLDAVYDGRLPGVPGRSRQRFRIRHPVCYGRRRHFVLRSFPVELTRPARSAASTCENRHTVAIIPSVERKRPDFSSRDREGAGWYEYGIVNAWCGNAATRSSIHHMTSHAKLRSFDRNGQAMPIAPIDVMAGNAAHPPPGQTDGFR